VLTKNFTVFIKFWRFNAFFDEAFTVTSRSKTIAALRLCVLDGNDSVEITYGINSVISKVMTFAENSETGQFLFLIMLILSYFTCS
jgi:hypothetical protein